MLFKKLRLWFFSCIVFLVACGGGSSDIDTISDDDIDTTIGDDIAGDCTPSIEESAVTAASLAAELISYDANIAYDQEAEERYIFSMLPDPVYHRDDGIHGVKLGDLSDDARTLLCELVDATMADSGVELVFAAMSADEVFGQIYTGDQDRNYSKDYYWVAIYGDPTGEELWSYKIEGHHMVLNVSLKGENIVAGPIVYGGTPLYDEDEITFLDDQQNYAIDFMALLDDDELALAVLNEHLGPESNYIELDVSSDSSSYEFPEPINDQGLIGTDLSDEQIEVLLALIRTYTDTLPQAQAESIYATVEYEIYSAYFTWEGSIDSTPFAYGIYMDSLRILYTNENDDNHAHIIFRVIDDEYGKSL